MGKHEIKRQKQWKQPVLYILTIVLSALFILAGRHYATSELSILDANDYGEIVVKARITEITDRVVEEYQLDENTTLESVTITYTATILSGDLKGETVTGMQNLDSLYATGIPEIEENDKVLLVSYEDSVDDSWQLMEFVHTDQLIIFGGLFVLALLLFGWRKGFNTLLSLSFTCMAVFMVFIPAILSGKNIYACAVIICAYTIFMTYLIVNGYNKKTLAAALGCIGGLTVSGLLTLLMDKFLSLTGYIDEDSIYLSLLSSENPINLNAIIFAGILIGALGAVMDVAMSISSSLWEVREKSNALSFGSLFKSGINIGRDIMGTMANTLILAYIGSSLSIVLLLSAYATSLLYLLNMEMITVEILQALVGSFGILLTLPLTSLISAALFSKKPPQAEAPENFYAESAELDLGDLPLEGE